MTNIITFDDFQDGEIRVTPDGRYSILDVIRFCSGYKSGGERKTWKRLCEQFSELVAKCHEYKFSGKGGAARPTPVATRENILYLIGLLPGAIGRSYRENAAKVFIQYLDASPELAESVIDRAKPEDLERIQLRLQGKKVRLSFTRECQERGVKEGWEFGACTNAIYQPILGGTAKEVREDRGLPARTNLRDVVDDLELAAITLSEQVSIRDMKRSDAQGFEECRATAFHAAQKVRKAIE